MEVIEIEILDISNKDKILNLSNNDIASISK